MTSATTRPAIEALARLTQDAFEGDHIHSVKANLRNLREGDWTAVPAGGGRSITDILAHVGWTKWVYEDHAFGSASLRWDQPPPLPGGGARPALLSWVEEGQRRWLAAVDALNDDSELERPRLAHWGEAPTRVLMHIVIAHDLYHAGEINHLRALIQGTDR